MKRPYVVPKDGNSIPVQSPLIRPMGSKYLYQCPDNKTLTVYAKIDPDVIKKYLEPTPFEYVDNAFMVYISDFTNADIGPFWDCGVVIPAKYKNVTGGHFLFEYENQDYSIVAGRELWGYPKKYAEVNMVETMDRLIATAVKNGREIIRLELDLKNKCDAQVPDTKFVPHLMLHTIPNADGPGIFSQRVLSRDTSPDFKTRVFRTCNAKMTLRHGGEDPLDEFSPAKIICGTYTTGEYFATKENGWAKVLDTIV
jgi:acetoacetate decarboxylase